MATKYSCDICGELFSVETDVKGLTKIKTAVDSLANTSDDTFIEILIMKHHGGDHNSMIDTCLQCKLHLMQNALKLNKL